VAENRNSELGDAFLMTNQHTTGTLLTVDGGAVLV
jgi:hypothetical protein